MRVPQGITPTGPRCCLIRDSRLCLCQCLRLSVDVAVPANQVINFISLATGIAFLGEDWTTAPCGECQVLNATRFLCVNRIRRSRIRGR